MTVYYQDSTVTLHHGHVLDVLPTLPDGSVDCAVTSPPYYGLRSYLPEGHPDKAKEIGTEKTPAEYVEKLRGLFAEVRRVLADDGTMWLNLGDSYSAGTSNNGGYSAKSGLRDGKLYANEKALTANLTGDRRALSPGVGPKNLLGMPWRTAFALQDDDSGDIYELNADAPEEIVSAVYLETCRIRTPKPPANTTGNTQSDGDRPTQSDTPNACEPGTRPTGTSSGSTARSTTNSTESKRSFARSEGTDSVTDDSDSLRCNTTEDRSQSAPAVESGGSRSCRSTTSTVAETSIAGNSELPVTASSNGSGERDTRKDSESSATTATHPADTTVRVRTKKNVRMRKAQIRPEWFPYFKLVKQERWILRNAIIWNKPNAMPESVTDRLSTRYEMLFMFSKSRKYWFDIDPIREGYSPAGLARRAYSFRSTDEFGKNPVHAGGDIPANALGKNPGDVWEIPTSPFPGSHFAVFPPELPRRCILAGCKPGGTVLDPFHGSGTTGMVATRNGRKYVGIELNKDYLDLSLRTRLADGVLDFEEPAS